MKLSELKCLIKEIIKEDYSQHQVQLDSPTFDELYELQIEKRDNSSWETIKTLQTFEQAKTEMLKLSADSQSFPAHYRVLGSKSKTVFDSKEILK